MGHSPHLFFFAFNTATFELELQVTMGPRLRLLISECKTSRLAPELLVSMGPSPHLRFLQKNSDFRTTIISLHGSQTSPMIFCIHN